MFHIKNPKIKISSKLLIYFLIVSVVPLSVLTYDIVGDARMELLKSSIKEQQIIADKTVSSVDNYLADKINTLFFQSHILSVSSVDTKTISQNLAVLIKQDPTIQKVSLLNSKGYQQVVFDTKGQIKQLNDQSGSDEFKAVIFLAGKYFLGPVSYDSSNKPIIKIAVPLLKSNLNQNLNDIAVANFGKYSEPEDILGVLVAEYDVSNLWQSVLSQKIGEGGYAYVVDGFGNLVAHPDTNFLAKKQNITATEAVSDFINSKTKTRNTVSETGQKVISTPRKLTNANWAVIVQEPELSIHSTINALIRHFARIIAITLVSTTLACLFFRRQLLLPINKLMRGIKKIESGEFDANIDVRSNDEFQELAETFNKMGINIKKLINDLRSNNLVLNDEQTKLNSIIQSVSDGIIALNSSGEIISINPPASKLVNKQPSELQNKLMSDYFSWVQESKNFMPELKVPGLHRYTNVILGTEANPAYLDLLVIVLDQKESEVATIITIHDLTQSRELDTMKLDFVAIAAHELRTPVAVVQGYLSLLDRDSHQQLNPYNIETLHKAMLGADELRDLINKLLNVSHIEHGEMDMYIEKLDLSKLVSDGVDHHQQTASMRQQKVLFNNSDGHVFVPADISSLNEVLNNLIGNALKYTEPGKNVMVNMSANNNQARVEVVDEGLGISEEHRAKLFTKFFRVEKSLITGNRGSGLGLYVSKSIMELLHGTIGIAPFSGKGSTFYFTLPIFDPAIHEKLVTKETQKGAIRGWIKKSSNS